MTRLPSLLLFVVAGCSPIPKAMPAFASVLEPPTRVVLARSNVCAFRGDIPEGTIEALVETAPKTHVAWALYPHDASAPGFPQGEGVASSEGRFKLRFAPIEGPWPRLHAGRYVLELLIADERMRIPVQLVICAFY